MPLLLHSSFSFVVRRALSKLILMRPNKKEQAPQQAVGGGGTVCGVALGVFCTLLGVCGGGGCSGCVGGGWGALAGTGGAGTGGAGACGVCGAACVGAVGLWYGIFLFFVFLLW